MIITSTTPRPNLVRTLLFGRVFGKNLFFPACFLLINLSSALLFAQSPLMHLNAIAPSWDGKEFCDGGNGYDAELINAPTISYTGAKVDEVAYHFAWERKINDGKWEEVSSGHKISFIPAFNPPVVFNKKAGKTDIYYWRLKVTDLINNNQTATSSTYTFKVISGLVASHKMIASTSNPGKFSIDLSVEGGHADKSFSWISLDKANKFPNSEISKQRPDGLIPGAYKVTISDKGCPSITETITVNKSQ